MNLRRHRPLAVLLAVLATTLACQGPRTWQRVEAERGFGDVWNTFEDIAADHGFRSDPAGTDRGLRVYRSMWRQGGGAGIRGAERSRLHAKFSRPDESPDAWLLEFYVEREVSGDMRRRLDPRDTDWEAGGQDGAREEVMLGQLRLRFDQELGITPSFDRDRR